MCQFNLVIVERNVEDSELKNIFRKNDLKYQEIDIKSLSEKIGKEFKIISTTKNECDCGSVIGMDSFEEDNEDLRSSEIKKLKRKKWSDSKIKRYFEDKEKSTIRDIENKKSLRKKELNNWSNLIIESFEKLNINTIGIFIHYFEGFMENEVIEVKESINMNLTQFDLDMLTKIRFDELFIIKRYN